MNFLAGSALGQLTQDIPKDFVFLAAWELSDLGLTCRAESPVRAVSPSLPHRGV